MPFDGLETPVNYLAKLDQVIDLIESPNRWIKHNYRNPQGYCLKEALDVAGISEIFEPIILKTVSELTEREFCCIESFNDHPETMHDDIVVVLHRVRADTIAGKFDLPAYAMPTPVFTWNAQCGPTVRNWVSSLWRKVFC